MLDEYTPSRLYPTSTDVDTKNVFAFLSDRESLKQIVADLCRTLHHPVALIDYNALNNAETTEKLESMVEMFPMRRSCSVFRKCAGDDYCKMCDNFHARCVGRDKKTTEERIRRFTRTPLPFFCKEYRTNLPHVLDGFSRSVVEYHCPMLGYRELLFPLMYQGNVFGVIFAGQILVYEENDQNKIKSISTSFFDSQPPQELFKDFISKYSNQNKGERLRPSKIKALINYSDQRSQLYDDILAFKPNIDNNQDLDNEDLDYYSKSFSTRKDYYAFVRRVCKALGETEEKIANLYEEKRKQIIASAIDPIAKRFDSNYGSVHEEKYRNSHEARTKELESAWKALETFAEELKQQSNIKNLIRSIILFGSGQSLKIEDFNRKPFVFSVPKTKLYKDSYFDYSCTQLTGVRDFSTSLRNPEILNGLSKNIRQNNSVLIQCHSIAMLLLVSDLSGHESLYQSLAEAVGKELTRINREISLCTANLMKEKYILTLRMYRHENAHISTRLMGILTRYFSESQRYLKIPEEKRMLVSSDMKNTVQLISNIADNLGFLTGVNLPQGIASQFDVVDMMYKWQIMFRDELAGRNLDVIIHRGGHTSTVGYKLSKYLRKFTQDITGQVGNYVEAPRKIRIDSRLFELLVYNIVDNAVKYAYRGTNIYMIWGRIDDDYELSITSYGPQMEEGDAMYGLYVRGSNSQDGQGDGLGLFVVKRIANKLGISVTHKCKKISNYHAALITWYNDADFSRLKGYVKIQDAVLRQNEDGPQATLAVNEFSDTKITEDDLTIDYLRHRIEWPTWRTTFRIRIPVRDSEI